MPRELREELADLANEDWIRELADREFTHETSRYNVTISAILPPDPEPINWDMVEAHGIDERLHKMITDAAGQNVAAHDVIRHYLTEAKRRHGMGRWVADGGTDSESTDDAEQRQT